MEWTKIPTSLIINRVSDFDLLSITKYQLLWAELEREPEESVALRFMTRKQLTTARQYLDSISASVSADIVSVEKARNRRRKIYLKNKGNAGNVTHTQTHTVTDGVTGSVTKQIRLDKNMYLYKYKYPAAQVPAGAEVKEKKPKRALNDLQRFSNAVIVNFEDNVITNEQKRIWFKRNCRCLTDILNFCGKDIPLALGTVEACSTFLEKSHLTGGYEAVCRNLPEYMGQAKKLNLEKKYENYK